MWKVLVVDDNFLNRQLFVDTLEDLAQCEVAVNGKEAMDKYTASLSGKKYDLVLLDIAMPEVNGIEFLKMLRDDEKARGLQTEARLPVIMVTAYRQPFIEALDRGCDDYILKPIDPDVLVKKIKDRLNK